MASVLRGDMKRDAIRRAQNTHTSYTADWRTFTKWCREHRLESLPATTRTVMLYSHAQLEAGRRVSTAIHHLSAINSYHQAAGYPTPANSEVWQFLLAIKRMRGEQPRQKEAVTSTHIHAMCAAQPATLRGIRDRAILTIGFASALRRSTLVALNVDDVEMRPEGLVLTIRREKQDRKGEGRLIGIVHGKHAETCPVLALAAWLKERGLAPGALFTPVYFTIAQIRRLQPAHIAKIVKQAARLIGLDAKRIGAHSLRAGMVTTALNNGVAELVVMAQTGHKNVGTLKPYYRRSDPFRGNASGLIGL